MTMLTPHVAPLTGLEAAAYIRRPFTITKLRRHQDGYWTATITANGNQIHADRMHGSWQTTIGICRYDVRRDVAAALQAKVRPLERAEKRDLAC